MASNQLQKTSNSPRRNDDPAASNSVGVRPIEHIVQECQQGDRGAQRELYEICHQRVYRLMVRMVGLQDAADLTQQVFLHVFRTIDQFSGRSQFETWVYRLAVNEALQYLRRSKRWQHRDLEDYEPMDDSQGHEQDAERKELLEQAMAHLKPELRSIFILREVEELSYREIAEALEIPEGTVGSRLNRARHELQIHLRDLGWNP